MKKELNDLVDTLNIQITAKIYADYLANKSNSDIHSENYKYETKLKKFNDCLEKNKIYA